MSILSELDIYLPILCSLAISRNDPNEETKDFHLVTLLIVLNVEYHKRSI